MRRRNSLAAPCLPPPPARLHCPPCAGSPAAHLAGLILAWQAPACTEHAAPRGGRARRSAAINRTAAGAPGAGLSFARSCSPHGKLAKGEPWAAREALQANLGALETWRPLPRPPQALPLHRRFPHAHSARAARWRPPAQRRAAAPALPDPAAAAPRPGRAPPRPATACQSRRRPVVRALAGAVVGRAALSGGGRERERRLAAGAELLHPCEQALMRCPVPPPCHNAPGSAGDGTYVQAQQQQQQGNGGRPPRVSFRQPRPNGGSSWGAKEAGGGRSAESDYLSELGASQQCALCSSGGGCRPPPAAAGRALAACAPSPVLPTTCLPPAARLLPASCLQTTSTCPMARRRA